MVFKKINVTYCSLRLKRNFCLYLYVHIAPLNLFIYLPTCLLHVMYLNLLSFIIHLYIIYHFHLSFIYKLSTIYQVISLFIHHLLSSISQHSSSIICYLSIYYLSIYHLFIYPSAHLLVINYLLFSMYLHFYLSTSKCNEHLSY